MKNPTRNLITRESLLTTASYNTRWFATLVAGTAVLGASALAESWVGDTSSDWNNNLNWPGDDGNAGNATVNLDPAGTPPPYRAIISANATQPVVDIFVADGANVVGRLDHTAGTANTGTGNWMYIGRGTGTNSGTYNLADTSGTGGTFTGFATGSGSMNVGGGSGTGGRLYIGGYNGTAGTGVVNVNTTGTLTVRNDMVIGESGGTATFNMDAGTVNTGGWNFCGRGSTGTFRVSGGTLNNSGRFYFGDTGTGTGIQTGGTVTNNDQLWIGQGATGQASYTISGGTIASSGWIAIGRQGGKGVLNLSGTGVFTKQGNDNFIMGSDAANGKGTINQTGGTLNSNNTMVVGAISGSEGVWNFSAGTANVANLQIANGGLGTLALSGTANLTATGTVSPGSAAGGTATVTLDGGSLTMPRMAGGAGAETVTFNGTQLKATSAVQPFIEALDTATIGAGGLLVDSNNLNITVPQIFGGTGGVVKTGNGSLILGGVSTYGGNNTISAGKLTLNASSTGTGSITVANNAGLGVSQADPANGLDPSSVSFGTGNTLDINLGNSVGNPTAAPLNVTGTLTVNGTVTVNVTDQMPAVGTVPLITYVGPKAGGGNFVLGTLPNGVVATLNDNGTGLVSLNVTAAALPRWDGTNESGLTKTASTTEFVTDVTVTDATGIVVGQPVRGTGIPTGTTVAAISGNTITLSQAATATAASVNLLFVTTAGTNEGVWDFVTENWFDQITNTSSLYADPNPVLFDDNATGPTAVTLNTTVAPSSVTFNNNALTYSLSGTGKITGSAGVTKSNAGTVTVSTANNNTGVTRFEGGTLSVPTLTNGGVAGPLGAATNAASNLVFAGGTLEYTGGAVTVDRGLTVAAGGDNVMSTVSVAGNVTTSGAVSTTLGKLTKDGVGTLTLTNPGANTIGNGSAGDALPQSLRVANGGLAFSVAGQTNTVTGRTGFGTAAGNTTTVALSNGATFTSTGRTQLGSADNTNVSLTISNASVFTSNDTVQTALNNGSVVNIVVQDSGSFNKPGTGWMSIGNGANGIATMTVKNSGSLSTGGDFNVGDTGTANGTLNLQDTSNTTLTGGMFIGKNATTGTVNVSGDANITTGNTNVGGGAGSLGKLNISGTANYVSNGRLQVGPDANSTGSAVTISEGGSLQVNSFISVGFSGGGSMTIKDNGIFTNNDDFSVNENGTAAADVNVQNNGSLTSGGTFYIGRNATRVGTLTVSGSGAVNQTNANTSLQVGTSGTGTLTIQGTGTVTSNANNGVIVAANGGSTGTVNLDGGTLIAKKVSDTGGTSAFHFNGGTLKANTGANLAFLAGIDTLDVKSGGAFIDSNGQTIAINQGIADQGGNVTKRGAGTLQLNASNPYVGTTKVEAGALGGTGSVGGELVVTTGSSIAPGAAGVGTFTVEDAFGNGSTIGGTYVCEINGATSDKLACLGALTLQAGSTLDIDVIAAPTAGAYIIASYGSLAGTFTTVTDLPAGYALDYNYQGLKQIALVQTASPYSTWAASFGLDPLTDGAPGADKDSDGQSNAIEFALGGSPISGSNNAKIYSLAADSDADVDTTKELVLTIAVRSGTPAFTGSPSPTATMDGYTYTIQGSTNLSGFPGTVLPTTAAVTTGLPAAPAGYEYRSFSLSGSNGFPATGFMRVLVTP